MPTAISWECDVCGSQYSDHEDARICEITDAEDPDMTDTLQGT